MKKLRVVVELTIDDLTEKDRDECAKMLPCDPMDLPGLDDIEKHDLDYLIESQLTDLNMFEGSDLYIMVTEAALISADWIDDTTSERKDGDND
jgi:hypothetical protein